MTKKAIFAAGCFWGVEYYFKKLAGVTSTYSGYTGGHKDDPSYDDVCYKDTGHLEAVEVTYDPEILDYEDLVKYFFEIHDFTQTNGQGPDIGEQYLSAIFTADENEKKIAEEVIKQLAAMDYSIASKILPMAKFWKAEEYHQNYYAKNGKYPYCHSHKQIF